MTKDFRLGERVKCVEAAEIGTVVRVNDKLGCLVLYDDGDAIWVLSDLLERVTEKIQQPISLLNHIKIQADDFATREYEIGEIDYNALYKGFFHGAKEMLRWHTMDELVSTDVCYCVAQYQDLDDCTVTCLCKWDGENFIDCYNDSVIRPCFYYPIPHNDNNHAK